MASKLQPVLFPLRAAKWRPDEQAKVLWEFNSTADEVEEAERTYEDLDTAYVHFQAEEAEVDKAKEHYERALHCLALAGEKVAPLLKDWWTR